MKQVSAGGRGCPEVPPSKSGERCQDSFGNLGGWSSQGTPRKLRSRFEWLWVLLLPHHCLATSFSLAPKNISNGEVGPLHPTSRFFYQSDNSPGARAVKPNCRESHKPIYLSRLSFANKPTIMSEKSGGKLVAEVICTSTR